MAKPGQPSASPARKKRAPPLGIKPPIAHKPRIAILVGVLLIFVACMLFDTQALLQLTWLGLRGAVVWLFSHKLLSVLAGLSMGAVAWGGMQTALPIAKRKSGGRAVSRPPARAAQPRRNSAARRTNSAQRL